MGTAEYNLFVPITVTVVIIIALLLVIIWQAFQNDVLRGETKANDKTISNLLASNKVELSKANAETESVKIRLQGSQKIVEELKELNKGYNQANDELINKMEQAAQKIENLSKAILRSGLRDIKGVVRKVKDGEIYEVIDGTHPILNKVEKKRKVKEDKPIRSVTSLSEKECIEVKNDEERDDILRLFEEAGITWKSGDLATSGNALYNRENLLLSENTLYFLIDGYAELNNITILPASDFIQPKNYKIDVNVMEQPIIMADSPTADGGVESKQVEPPKPTRDWSVPQAFPEGYQLKKGVNVLSISSHHGVPIFTKGVVMENNALSYIDWENNEYRSFDNAAVKINGGKPYWCYQLAPINPLDHPEHPQFNKK